MRKPVTLGYHFWMAVSFLPLLLSNIRRAIKYRSLNFLLQRYACSLPAGLGGWVCVQCTGVAEIRGAAALITRLQALGYSAFVCLLNPTDCGVASKNFPDIPRVYLPVDFRFVVRRWLRHIAPSAIVVVEAGIKPNFLATANSSNPPIPTALVNARFSGCTTAPPILARKTIFHIFRQMQCVLVRNEDDVKTFISLGARASTVKVSGNLKYSAIPSKCDFPCPSDSIPYVLAISTREGEEEIILEAWTAIPLKPLLVLDIVE